MGVVALHFNAPFSFEELGNQWSTCAVSSLFGCAVNIFILISGYFSCYSDKRSLGKPINLVLQLIVYREIYYMIQVLSGNQLFSTRVFVGWMVPNNYFVILFVSLYFISPYINMVMRNLSNKERTTMVLLLFVSFSIWPTITDMLGDIKGEKVLGLSSIAFHGSLSGYSIVNFALLYIVGAYLRLNDIKTNRIFSLVIGMVAVVIITVTAKWEYNRVDNLLDSWGWSYCNPIVIIESVTIFLFFNSLSFKNRVINSLAKAAFSCYLIHGFVLPYLNIGEIVIKGSLYYIVYLLIVMVLLFFLSYIVYVIYNNMTSKMIKALDNYQIPYKS